MKTKQLFAEGITCSSYRPRSSKPSIKLKSLYSKNSFIDTSSKEILQAFFFVLFIFNFFFFKWPINILLKHGKNLNLLIQPRTVDGPGSLRF